MTQYIPKAAVVAEIEKIRNQEIQWMKRQGYTEYHQGLRDGYANILSFLDTLEAKDTPDSADLEEEIENELERTWCGEYLDTDKFRESAKHFYELGLKAKGE